MPRSGRDRGRTGDRTPVELLDLVILIVANGIVDTIFVAYVAGIRSKKALVSWLKSEDAGPYYDQIADRAADKATAAIEPKVNAKLEDVHKAVAHLEARISAELPHPDVAIADMRTDLEAQLATTRSELQAIVEGIRAEIGAKVDKIDVGIQGALQELDRALEEVPKRVEMGLLSREGVNARQIQAMANAAGADVQEAVNAAFPDDPRNAAMARVRAILTKPVSPEYEANNPLGALIVETGKAALAQEFFGQGDGRLIRGAAGAARRGGGGTVSPYG